MNNADKAEETFKNGFNCAQAVFSALSEKMGIDDTTAKKIACGFGGGMSHMGQTCGAITGAIMAIGLKYGMTDPEDKAAKEKTFELVQELRDRFIKQHGSIMCKDLLGYDFSKPEDATYILENKINKQRCPVFVRTAAEIADGLISEGHKQGI